MTAVLVPFAFEGRSVRILPKAGTMWFVASDVCAALGVQNARDALSRLDDDEKGVGSTDTPGGLQEVAFVNEPGLYSLTLSSRKPEAKRFKRWVTHEVLPALRKTGSYQMPVSRGRKPKSIEGPSKSTNFKLTPRTQRLLEAQSRALGENKTQAVERAIEERARRLPELLRIQTEQHIAALAEALK